MSRKRHLNADTLLADFPAFSATRPAADRDARAAAAGQLTAHGLPGRGREDWKYNDLRPLADLGLRGPGEPGAWDRADAEARFTPGLDAVRLIFVDGRLASELPAAAGGLELSVLSELPAGFGELAPTADAAFTALNAAWWSDGLLVDIADDVELERPLELVFLNSAAASGRLTCPRLFVRAGARSRATLVENHAGHATGHGLVSAVTEVDCGEEAEFRHVKLLRDGAEAWHVGSTHVAQAARSRYRSREFALGGTMTRRELHLSLNGAEALCDLNALYLGADDQRHDLRTRVRHAAPDCRTRELYKGVLADGSRGIFDGFIYVAQDAQRTDAQQTNRNLLLSRDATANSMPRLEIYADDVKCTHGCTTGQIDDEQLFYLRSRGFDPDSARALLTYAFAREIVESVESPALREELTRELMSRLPGSELIGGGL